MNVPTITDPWRLKSDLSLRRWLFEDEVFAHPAKMHLGLMQRLVDMYSAPGDTLFDPMAGTGSLLYAATLGRHVVLRELEPDYLSLIQLSLPKMCEAAGYLLGKINVGWGDARLPFNVKCDHILFSPPYGFETKGGDNTEALRRRAERLAQNVGTSRRWQKYINEPTHGSFANGFRYPSGQSNTGNKSGRNYWKDMRLIYTNCLNVLPPAGLMIVVLKNSYRRGKLNDVTGQTIREVDALGGVLIARHGRLIDKPSIWVRRRREKGLPIIDVEDVLVFRKGTN